MARNPSGIAQAPKNDKLRARILVVDDHAPTCELISEILCSAGMDADSATNSAEAAARPGREKFHAVFLEMRMPPPDGIELARQVRASLVNTSTVIVTRHGLAGHSGSDEQGDSETGRRRRQERSVRVDSREFRMNPAAGKLRVPHGSSVSAR